MSDNIATNDVSTVRFLSSDTPPDHSNHEVWELTWRISSNTGYGTYNRTLARFFGLQAAVFIDDLVSKQKYFIDKGTVSGDGWFFNTEQNREVDTTLSPFQQSAAIKKLIECGLLKVERHGQPPKQWFWINHPKYQELILKKLDNRTSRNLRNLNKHNSNNSNQDEENAKAKAKVKGKAEITRHAYAEENPAAIKKPEAPVPPASKPASHQPSATTKTSTTLVRRAFGTAPAVVTQKPTVAKKTTMDFDHYRQELTGMLKTSELFEDSTIKAVIGADLDWMDRQTFTNRYWEPQIKHWRDTARNPDGSTNPDGMLAILTWGLYCRAFMAVNAGYPVKEQQIAGWNKKYRTYSQYYRTAENAVKTRKAGHRDCPVPFNVFKAFERYIRECIDQKEKYRFDWACEPEKFVRFAMS